MIKREALKFYSQEKFNDYLSQLSDETKILHYNVLEDVHYIITERELSDDEGKDFKMQQLRKDIAFCNAYWEKVIKDREMQAHNYKVAGNFEMSNLYMQRREEAMDEYNKEQRKLTNKLDKLVKLDYTGFIR